MMQQMRAELDTMQRKVNLMQSETLNIQDVNTRNALSTDAELWQQLVSTMKSHLDHMQQMQDQMMQRNMQKGSAPTPPRER